MNEKRIFIFLFFIMIQIGLCSTQSGGQTNDFFLYEMLQVITPENIDKLERIYTLKGSNVTFLGQSNICAIGLISDKLIKIWDAERQEEIMRFGNDLPVYGIASSPDGRWIVSLQFDNLVRVWDTETGRMLVSFAEKGEPLLSACFSPNGRLLVTGWMDHKIIVYKTGEWEKLLIKTDHQGPVFSFSFSRDDAFMISGGGHDDPTLRKWNTAHFKEMGIIGRCKMDIHNMALSADETVLATASNTVHLWDMEGGPVTELEGHTRPVYQAVFSSAGDLLATAGAPGLLIVWDVNRKKILKKIKSNQNMKGVRYKDGSPIPVDFTDAEFSHDGKMLASALDRKEIIFWGIMKR